MANTRKNINIEKIIEYWSLPEQGNFGGFIPLYSDQLEYPKCQCCGMEYETWKNIEKAHIVPLSLGGSNDPSNFLLLCKECHKNLPDINNREYNLKYVESYFTNFLQVFNAEFNKYVKENNISNNVIIELLEKFSDKDEMINFLKTNMSHHREDTFNSITLRKIPKMIGLFDKMYKDKTLRQPTKNI